MITQTKGVDFFEYWDSLGFFDNIQVILPPQFLLLFEIARTLFDNISSLDALNAIETISTDETTYVPDREASIAVNRMEYPAPVGDRLEIEIFKNVTDLKKALPRELALDDDIFNAKLFTKTLMVQKFYESRSDNFKPISTVQNEKGREVNRFEQLFYILLDTSRSMDKNLRLFYAKCIVVEFFRRKLNTNARLFFRTFDSDIGELNKIEKKGDYPHLIEKVLFSTTGGVSTNLQKAVYQAVNDINYNKDMANAEILVVTDGISRIDVTDMMEKLGKIKLHVLKIGDEYPEPDYYDMKARLIDEHMNFDPSSINMKEIHKLLYNQREKETPLTKHEQRIFHLMVEYSERMFKDLKRVSKNYIEVGDIQTGNLYDISDENIENIKLWINKIENNDFGALSLEEQERIYKQAYFLGQYIRMLVDRADRNLDELKAALDRVESIKKRLMSNTELFLLIVRSGKYHEDRKKLKLDRKTARKLMRQMSQKQNITMRDMRRAQLTFSFEPGDGGGAKVLLLLIIKLFQLIWSIITYPFNRSSRQKPEKFSRVDYFNDSNG